MSLKTRLDRLQAEYQRRTIAAIAAEQGLTYEELMQEAEEFLAFPSPSNSQRSMRSPRSCKRKA
jgi:hypothetical protein